MSIHTELELHEEIVLPENDSDTVLGYATEHGLRFVAAPAPSDILGDRLSCWELAREQRGPWTFLLLAYTQGDTPSAALSEETVFVRIRERADFAPLTVSERLPFDDDSASLVRAYRAGLYHPHTTLPPYAVTKDHD